VFLCGSTDAHIRYLQHVYNSESIDLEMSTLGLITICVYVVMLLWIQYYSIKRSIPYTIYVPKVLKCSYLFSFKNYCKIPCEIPKKLYTLEIY